MSRMVEATAPDGTRLSFRAPTREEFSRRTNDLASKPNSVVERELCFATSTIELDALKGVFSRWPGIPRAAYEAMLSLVAYDAEFTGDDHKRIAKLDDGTVVELQAPGEMAWNHFRDESDTQRSTRLEELAMSMIVQPSGDTAIGALLDKYPGIVIPISDEAVDLVGSSIKFTAKKG